MPVSRPFHVEEQKGVPVVCVDANVGSLDDSKVLMELDAILELVRSRRPGGLVFDFDGVQYFGSSLLEALRAVHSAAAETGTKLALCNLSPVSREIIDLARFDAIWPVCSSRDEAIATVERV